MKKIPLTQGKYAIVDDDMFDALKECAQDTNASVEQAVTEILEVALFEHEDETVVEAGN